MKKIYEALSVILHPVFVPAYGTYVYMKHLPVEVTKMQHYIILFLVLGGTFVVPMLTMLLFRVLGHIKTLRATSIEERRIPIILMVVNYTFLGFVLGRIGPFKELAILAMSCALGLIITLILFRRGIKSSLHMLGITGLLGLTIIFGIHYYFSLTAICAIIFLSGLLATARLQLKAHDFKEIIIGSCLGTFIPVVLYFVI